MSPFGGPWRVQVLVARTRLLIGSSKFLVVLLPLLGLFGGLGDGIGAGAALLLAGDHCIQMLV